MRQIATLFLAALGVSYLSACGEGLEPVAFQGVSGQVTLIGAVPESSEWLRIAAYREVPQEPLDFLDLAAFSDTLPLAADQAEYAIALDPGVYSLVLAFWKPLDAPVTQLRVGGWYNRDSTAFAPPRSAAVEADSETGGIDVVVRLDSLLSFEQAVERLR